MKKINVGFICVVLCFLSFNDEVSSFTGGDKTYSEGVSGTAPDSFSLKKGSITFQCRVSDGSEYKHMQVTRLCFKDNTYQDVARNEGDTYIHGKRKGSDIETKIHLRNIRSIEIVQKNGKRLFAKEENSGEFYALIRVTLNAQGQPPEELMINPDLSVAFSRSGVGDERAYLYKLDRIEEIREVSIEDIAAGRS